MPEGGRRSIPWRRPWFWGGVFLLLGMLGMALLTRLAPHSGIQPQVASGLGGALQEMVGVDWYWTQKGRIQHLTAQRVVLQGNGRFLTLEGLRVEKRSSSGEGMFLEGERGVLDLVRNHLQVFGETRPVAVTWGTDYLLLVQRLMWQVQQQVIRSGGPVVVEGPRIHLEGVGLVGDLARGTWEVPGGVRAILGP